MAEETKTDVVKTEPAKPEVLKLADKAPPVEIVGGPGQAGIYGRGFGTSGTLSVGGQAVKTSSWADHSIKFVLPEGAGGEVVLTTASGVRRGTYPTKK